jgi:hypothetical protein
MAAYRRQQRAIAVDAASERVSNRDALMAASGTRQAEPRRLIVRIVRVRTAADDHVGKTRTGIMQALSDAATSPASGEQKLN